jgi:hypothetical protein
MPSRVQTLRSSVKGVRPAGGSREAGELYVNFADRQLGMINAAKAPVDLVAVRWFAATSDYAVGDYVVQAGQLYRSKNIVTAGAFNTADWDALSMVPADLLTAIKTVDGVGSGLDADLLDGQDSTVFATNANVVATYAPIASPVFTGDPRITTTPPNTDSDTSIASTAFVKSVRLDMFAQPNASVGMNSQLITALATPANPTDAANKSYVDGQVATKLGDAPSDGSTYGRKNAAWAQIVAGGNVNGPATAHDNGVARFDGTTGKLVQDSNSTMDDSGNLVLGGQLTVAADPTSALQVATKQMADAKVSTVGFSVISATGSGNYVKPADLKFLKVTLVGGGGGSQNLGAAPSGQSNAGGGGGAAGICIGIFAAASLAASEAYVVAAGGAAANNGGTTTFKGLSASGGNAAGAGTGSGTTWTYAGGGAPGIGSGGSLNLSGENGGYGYRAAHGAPAAVVAGSGGGNMFAARIIEIPGQVNGGGANFPGGGSRGTGSSNGTGAATGGPGAGGCIIFEEYR